MIRKMQAQAQWAYLKNNVLSVQSNCNFSTCTQISGCSPINYVSYAQRDIISLGKYNCTSCSLSTTTICVPS